jgi:hypothetical protein
MSFRTSKPHLSVCIAPLPHRHPLAFLPTLYSLEIYSARSTTNALVCRIHLGSTCYVLDLNFSGLDPPRRHRRGHLRRAANSDFLTSPCPLSSSVVFYSFYTIFTIWTSSNGHCSTSLHPYLQRPDPRSVLHFHFARLAYFTLLTDMIYFHVSRYSLGLIKTLRKAS